MPYAKWTQKQAPSCWIDGAFGHEYVRQSLWSEVDMLNTGNQTELVRSLRGPMPDDAWDEDEAIEYLNGYCQGCYFTFSDGDVLLVLEDSEA